MRFTEGHTHFREMTLRNNERENMKNASKFTLVQKKALFEKTSFTRPTG